MPRLACPSRARKFCSGGRYADVAGTVQASRAQLGAIESVIGNFFRCVRLALIQNGLQLRTVEPLNRKRHATATGSRMQTTCADAGASQ